jgi:hypothetical protein
MSGATPSLQAGAPRPGGAAPDGQPAAGHRKVKPVLSADAARRFEREIAKYPPEG